MAVESPYENVHMKAHMKMFMLYVVFIFISTCLQDIHVLSGVVTVQ